MWLLLLAVIVALVLVLILRPGSSWHVERRLQASGIRPSSAWRLPLYGNFWTQDLTLKSLLPTDGEQTVPTYFVTFGNIFVPLLTFRESAEVWVAMLDWPKHEASYSALEMLTFGPTVVSLNGKDWHATRVALNRVFNRENMDRVREIVMQRTDELIERWKQQGTNVDVLHGVIALTFGVILEFVFGRPVSNEQIREGMRVMSFGLELSWELVKAPLMTMARMLLPFGEFARHQAAYKRFIMSFIEEARRNPPGAGAAICVMLESGWTDAKILSECAALVFAGHDTTASAVTSAINELLSNEALIEGVRSDDGQLRYSQSVMREALRLWSPVFSTSVRCMPADLTLSNGMVLPKGCMPLPMIGAMHRSEANFKNPLVFDPSRPAGEGMALPFSRGPRNCVGSPLALLEGPIVINRVMSQLKLTRRHEPTFEWMQTWKPKGLIVDCEAL